MIAAVAYLLLLGILVASRKRRGSGGPGAWLIAAVGGMMAWALISALSLRIPDLGRALGSFSETLRSGGWLLFLAVLTMGHWRSYGRMDLVRVTRFGVVAALAFLLVLDLLVALHNFEQLTVSPLVPQVLLLARMATAVVGVFLLDNLYRNTAATDRWGIKLLGLGLGGIFLYDFFFFADAVLSSRFSTTLYEARGAVNALVVPLFAISAARNPGWKLNVFVSRGAVIHTASLIASGIYLVVMGAAGYYLRDLGGRWGTILQVTFWFGSLLLLLVIVFSGQFRARMRVLVSKHFFNYRFDYREEWLRFIATLSQSEMAHGLPERVIQAVADIADSPGGALWQRDDMGYYTRTAVWNFKSDLRGVIAPDDPFITFIGERAWLVDFQEMPERPDLYEGCQVPDWLQHPRAWLVVPLLHHSDELLGFIVLERPRAPRVLNWEDRDILKTVGRQVASYLAEQSAEKALAEAQQFDEFNKRFAFIIHDIKNLASQLSLLVKNADRHAGNPEFQRDMILTVRDSVDKMQTLLTRLNRLRESDGRSEAAVVDLLPILRRLTAMPRRDKVELTFSCDLEAVPVHVDPVQIETVFTHLLQNALDAVGAKGRVDVRLTVREGWALATVADNGPGMDEAFVRDELFRPFRTTKAAGYGIGAYEARQIVRHFGGRLEVDSAPGQGTRMTVRLPLEREQGETGRPERAAGGNQDRAPHMGHTA